MPSAGGPDETLQLHYFGAKYWGLIEDGRCSWFWKEGEKNEVTRPTASGHWKALPKRFETPSAESQELLCVERS